MAIKEGISGAEMRLLRCDTCGSLNRVRLSRLREGRVPVCGECRSPLSADGKVPVGPAILTDATFGEWLEASPLPVLLDCWAGWCGPCLMIAPIVEQLAAELAGRVRVAKLNVDENPQTAARFRISSLPTMLLLSRGQEVGRLVGALPREAILQELARRGLL
jgi:thioredoxin 2